MLHEDDLATVEILPLPDPRQCRPACPPHPTKGPNPFVTDVMKCSRIGSWHHPPRVWDPYGGFSEIPCLNSLICLILLKLLLFTSKTSD